MAYTKLDLDCKEKWPRVEWFVRNSLELYLIDVHHMLRLPLKEKGIGGGCNFSAAHTLLAAVGGVSTMLYNQRKGPYGEPFKGVLRDFYPWDAEQGGPPADKDKDEVVNALWHEFRGVLSHFAGVPMEWDKTRGQWAPAQLGYAVKIKRWVKVNGNGLAESKIETLEKAKKWPFTVMKRTLEISPHAKVLKVERFYWGVRRMIEGITRCDVRMRNAERYLNQKAKHPI